MTKKKTDWTFGGLWPYQPRWHDTPDGRMHYIDEGPRHGRPVVLVHGNPAWGFLYRSFVPPLIDAGYRVIVPDHLGFGRSDVLAMVAACRRRAMPSAAATALEMGLLLASRRSADPTPGPMNHVSTWCGRRDSGLLRGVPPAYPGRAMPAIAVLGGVASQAFSGCGR